MWKDKIDIKLYWTANIGPKWQIVIPKEVRDILNIKPWDSMTIILKSNKVIWLIKNEDISLLLEYVNSYNNNEKKDKF